MDKNTDAQEEEIWIKFLRRHWRAVIIFLCAASIAAIDGLFVFLWYKDVAQATGVVPPITAGLDNWTIGYIFTFIINVIVWELLFVGVPVATVAIVVVLHWWKKLPEEEREEYQREPKKRTPRSGITAGSAGGTVWGLTVLAWLIIVYVDGMWNVTFSNWTLNYLIYSSLTAFFWVLLVAGVPVSIFFIWWLRREIQKPTSE
ncbi:MAG: hypothetical protein ACTSRS_00610 [Candidatus Helarchaeota archaeon]